MWSPRWSPRCISWCSSVRSVELDVLLFGVCDAISWHCHCLSPRRLQLVSSSSTSHRRRQQAPVPLCDGWHSGVPLARRQGRRSGGGRRAACRRRAAGLRAVGRRNACCGNRHIYAQFAYSCAASLLLERSVGGVWSAPVCLFVSAGAEALGLARGRYGLSADCSLGPMPSMTAMVAATTSTMLITTTKTTTFQTTSTTMVTTMPALTHEQVLSFVAGQMWPGFDHSCSVLVLVEVGLLAVIFARSARTPRDRRNLAQFRPRVRPNFGDCCRSCVDVGLGLAGCRSDFRQNWLRFEQLRASSPKLDCTRPFDGIPGGRHRPNGCGALRVVGRCRDGLRAAQAVDNS